VPETPIGVPDSFDEHAKLMYELQVLANPNEHNHFPLPLLVAGGASGKLQGGRHLKFAERTPMSNLLLGLSEKVDIQRDTLGDSTGKFDHLNCARQQAEAAYTE
jgi:hypothetical protein